jgi:uncharacterized membrane protein YdjX (TVP38/TMEM64 family)
VPPRRAVFRFLLLLALVGGAAALFRWTPLGEILDRERVTDWILHLRRTWWAPLAFVALYLPVCVLGLPVSALIFAGGAAFGVKLGWVYNLIGSLAGAGLSFAVGRVLGQEFIAHLVGEERLRRIESLLERHGFWAIVRARFIVPFVLVNYASALVRVRFSIFAGATVLGLAPSVLIYTYFGHAFFTVSTQNREAVLRNLTLTVILIVLLSLVVPIRRAWKRRRYRETDNRGGDSRAGS